VKRLPAGLIFVVFAPNALAQGAGAPGGAVPDAAYCASLRVQMNEMQGVKAAVEELNERATTSLGVNPLSENFAIPRIMERVDAQRREADALRQNIEVRKSSFLSEWDAALAADIARYNSLQAGISRDLAEIQSRQDTAMHQITLNKAAHGYEQAVAALERLQGLFALRGCK
jgi:hypothetical protein